MPAWAGFPLGNTSKDPVDKSPSRREFCVCPFLAKEDNLFLQDKYCLRKNSKVLLQFISG